MEYIRSTDYEYIINKYHDASKPWDGHARFIRRDGIFDPATGMDGDAIKEGILREDKKRLSLPHPIRKALAFSYVLENTRISCDPRDRFPAINAIDRPLNATLISAWKIEVFHEILPEVGAHRKYLEEAGIVTIRPDYDHSVPLWERILSLGFPGLLCESETARKKKPHTEEEETFFEGIRITYEAIVAFVGRLASLAEKTAGSERMATALRRLETGAPTTFYEALLLDYLYFMICEHIEGLQVRSLSNFDRLFYPFYRSDLERGVSERVIREDLAYFFLQFTAIGNYWNQPVYLGGCKEDESTVINELSYLFLDVYDKMRIYNPKIQLKIADSTPRDFTEKALDMIRRGNNSIVFVSDATIRKALVRHGVSPEEARLCDVKGCYEYSVRGSYGTGMNYLNLLKPLEYALHEGKDGVTGHFSGCASPSLNSYRCFDDLYAEYKRQLLFLIGSTMKVTNSFEDYLSYINPLSMLSATFPSCLARGRDAIHGGSIRNSTTMEFGFIADLADSLTMIQKYIYDEKLLTLGAFTEILDKNFEGHETFRLRLYNDREKYGNNKERPDAFAVDIVNFITKHVCGKPNARERGNPTHRVQRPPPPRMADASARSFPKISPPRWVRTARVQLRRSFPRRRSTQPPLRAMPHLISGFFPQPSRGRMDLPRCTDFS